MLVKILIFIFAFLIMHQLFFENILVEGFKKKKKPNIKRVVKSKEMAIINQENEIKAELESYKKQINSQKNELEIQKAELESYKEQIDDKTNELERQKEELESYKEQINMQENNLKRQNSKLESYREHIDMQKKYLVDEKNNCEKKIAELQLKLTSSSTNNQSVQPAIPAIQPVQPAIQPVQPAIPAIQPVNNSDIEVDLFSTVP